MRLIDADELVERLKDTRLLNTVIAISIDELNNAPTIDAVEVVRCEECMHKYVTGDTTQYYVCDFMDAQFDENGYCSHGERIK